MIAMLQDNWPVPALLLLLLLTGLLFAWWIGKRRRPGLRQRYQAPDALDEGALPAARNQAFIDAPSAAAALTAPLAASGPDILGGIGEIAAWGAAREIEDLAPAGSTAPVAGADPPFTPGPATADDLTRIKGVGGKLSARLGELGVTSFAQIAGWSDADLARIDGALGVFAGRPARDHWVAQCRYLASGDLAGYEAQFGKL